MTAASSTTAVTHSDDGGINDPSRRRNLPSPWANVVRGGGEAEPVTPRSPRASKQHSVVSDQLAVLAITEADGDESNCGNAAGGKKSAWNKPSANIVVDGSATPVMGAASWPALSESARSVPKSSPSPEESSDRTSDGLVTVFQAPVTSEAQLKPAKISAKNNSNTTTNHHSRQRSNRRGGSAGGASAGYNRPLPPPPPPLPPPFPFFDMQYCNYIPPEQPPLKGNSWVPRPMAGSARRNNFGPRPRGGGAVGNNGFGGRGPRNPVNRDVHAPQQIVAPPPPLPPRGYFRQPHSVPPSYIPGPPVRPYGTPMGYDMAAPLLYVTTPLLPQAAPPPIFISAMEPLHIRILNQIEYYFSVANLVKDNFLRSNMDEEGWVPIALIAGFRRVQILTTDVQMILNSLKDSSSVEIQGDKIRRRNDWRKWVQTADFPADSNSQSPRRAPDDLLEETSVQKLTLEEITTMKHNTNSDAVKDIDQKEVKELTVSSELVNEGV